MSVFTGTELSLELGMEGIVSGMSGMSGMSKMTKIMNEIITKIKYNTDHSHTHTPYGLSTRKFGVTFFSHLNIIKYRWFNGLRKIWHIEI